MKKTKPIFDFEAEGLDEAKIDEILTRSESGLYVVKIPPSKWPLEKQKEKFVKDIFNAFVSVRNDLPAGDAIAIGVTDLENNKLSPHIFIEPPNQDRAAITKEKLTFTKKTRKKGGQYDYTIRRLSGLINDPNITSAFRNQCEEQKKYLQNLQTEERLADDQKGPLEGALKINQVIDQKIYDLCQEILKERSDITIIGVKCFRLVAEILAAKGIRGFDFLKVKTAYGNLYNKRG